MTASDPSPFAAWLRDHATALTHLDPDAPQDDLEPLGDMIGDARVVAIGENSHFIREFSALRQRILRYLVERCGFTVLAFEYGFGESLPLDAWAHGEGAEEDLAGLTGSAIPVGLDAPLRWIRRHNATASPHVRFAGVDIPAAGGSLLPALEPVEEHLRVVDPELLPTIRTAKRIAESFAGDSGAVAAPAWERLPAIEQDALTASLARLLIRYRSVAPLHVSRGGREAYNVALQCLEGACHADYTFRAMAGLFSGGGLTADTSAREVYMAGSVRWHLERLGPGTRMVLAAHNAHIQKAPISFDGRLTSLPMGQHLHDALGDDYFALGLTSTAGHTAEMHRDENARFGFTVENAPLGPPAPGSVEEDFADSGVGFGLAGLRGVPRDVAGPDRIRIQAAYMESPVLAAFDGVLNVPVSTVADDLGET
ncbi:erythromycin esterase [Stackebrandtia albiflava]|uniref:Erythromycin esterase n=1 Tax=Stackebrandtia albiflava TaxID=406432 RepID=A0A562VH44_9ACTN|nr:erythromycin esterase family protein [Stackebrandtia albiflava]TWJ17178.1 erythromycin esterase [Stackebrandtia albiflava]